MARGGQDFGYPDYAFGASGVDNNEIQQMLLGFGLVDGMGRTLLYDDFSQGLSKWAVFQSIAGFTPILWNITKDTTGVTFRSPFCVEMPVTAAAGNWGQIASGIICGEHAKVGIEVGFVAYNNCPRYRFTLDYKTNGAALPKQLDIRLDEVANTITLLKAGGSVVLDTFSFIGGDGSQRVQLKMVGNFSTQKYATLIVGEKKYDVSNYDIATGLINAAGKAQIRLYAESVGFTNSGYIGYCRLTKDEP